MGEATQKMSEYLRVYEAAEVQWKRIVQNATGNVHQTSLARRELFVFGRPYYMAFHWLPEKKLGYIHHGFTDEKAQDQIKFVAKLEKSAHDGKWWIEPLDGLGFPVEDDASVKEYHDKCLLAMDEAACHKVKTQASGPNVRTLD